MKYGKNHIKDKKEAILHEAVKIFAKKGYKGTTVKEIAEAAGVAEGTIFNYFDTKKDILTELAATSNFGFLDVSCVHAKIDKNSIEDVLKEFIQDWVRNIINNLELYKVLFYESQFYEEIGDSFFKELVFKGREAIELMLGEQMQHEEYKEFSSQNVIEFLIGLSSIFIFWDEFGCYGDIWSNQDSYDMITNQITEIFLYGIINTRNSATSVLI